MQRNGLIPWESLERWRASMFLLGAAILAINSGIVLYDVVQGTEVRLPLGQVFVGTGWAAVLVGMLGLYPALADRRPRLARASAFFAGVGAFGYAAMAVAFAAAVAGVPMDTVASAPIKLVYFPAVAAGTFLAFPLYAAATLLTGAYSRTVGVLLAAPTVVFVANVATGATADSIFGVLVALVLVFGATGYLLRSGASPVENTQPAAQTAAE